MIKNLALLHKIKIGHPSVPSGWCDYFVFKDTRSGCKIETPKIRLEVEKKLFFNYIVYTFNSLNQDLRDEIDSKNFVNLLNKHFKNYPFDYEAG